MSTCDHCERFAAVADSPVCLRCAVELARAGAKLPRKPTDAPPGSQGKLVVLELRAALKLALWHPDDASSVLARPRARNVDRAVRGIEFRDGRYVPRVRFGPRCGPILDVRLGRFELRSEAEDAARAFRAALESGATLEEAIAAVAPTGSMR